MIKKQSYGTDVKSRKMVFGLLALLFAGTACSQSAAPVAPPHKTGTPQSDIPLVMIGPASFTGYTNIIISAGTPLQCVDPLYGGGAQQLYIDTVKSHPLAGIPAELKQPQYVLFKPGVQKYFIFTTAGVYYLRSMEYPQMQVEITVSAASNFDLRTP